MSMVLSCGSLVVCCRERGVVVWSCREQGGDGVVVLLSCYDLNVVWMFVVVVLK